MVGKHKKLYLCDGKKECGTSPFCGVNGNCKMCFHTQDPDHAKNRGKEMRFEFHGDILVEEENGRIIMEVE